MRRQAMKNCCQPWASFGKPRRPSKSGHARSMRAGSPGSPKPGRRQKPRRSQYARSWFGLRRREPVFDEEAIGERAARLHRPRRGDRRATFSRSRRTSFVSRGRRLALLAEDLVDDLLGLAEPRRRDRGANVRRRRARATAARATRGGRLVVRARPRGAGTRGGSAARRPRTASTHASSSCPVVRSSPPRRTRTRLLLARARAGARPRAGSRSKRSLHRASTIAPRELVARDVRGVEIEAHAAADDELERAPFGLVRARLPSRRGEGCIPHDILGRPSPRRART